MQPILSLLQSNLFAISKRTAAGHAVAARGGFRVAGPVNREPQLLAS
jgi:hypothetical protein